MAFFDSSANAGRDGVTRRKLGYLTAPRPFDPGE
jgi:hypothetical protein